MRIPARAAWGLTIFAIVAAGILVVSAAPEAWAQPSPFGVGRPQPPPPPPTGVTGWIITKQAEFYRQFSGLIRAAKADGSAVWTLLGVSFLYGIFHAAGPGHGKAVISSYLIATGETWWRGIVLAFASALLQAIVAIAFVGIAAILLNATAATMRSAVWYVEVASYALIALIGARLLWVKGSERTNFWIDMARRRLTLNQCYSLRRSKSFCNTIGTQQTKKSALREVCSGVRGRHHLVGNKQAAQV